MKACGGPDGLWGATTKQVDTEAIGTWILDVYLKARVSGMSDAEARQRIADAIRGSDEWRRAHAAAQTPPQSSWSGPDATG